MDSLIHWLGSLSGYEQFLFVMAVSVMVAAVVGWVLAIRRNRRDGEDRGGDDWGSWS